MLEDLEDRLEASVPGEEQPWQPPWRLAVTTFYHVHEGEKLVEPRGIETFALLTETTLDGLKRLAELSDETPVGVMGNSQTCTENLLRSLEGAGLDHLMIKIQTLLNHLHMTMRHLASLVEQPSWREESSEELSDTRAPEGDR